MERTNKARTSAHAQRKPSLRMKTFIDNVIQEVEEAGIKDKDAVGGSEATSGRVTASVGPSRTRRQQFA